MNQFGTQYEHLKFRAEFLKHLGFAAGTPFSLIFMDIVMHGLELNALLPVKLLVAYFSCVASIFLFGQSHATIEDREWRLGRDFRRSQS